MAITAHNPVNFFEHLAEIEKNMGGALTLIEGEKHKLKCYVMPATINERMGPTQLRTNGQYALGTLQCLFDRAMDENGNLLFDSPEKREAAVQQGKAFSALIELGNAIMDYDDDLQNKASEIALKNLQGQPGSG